MVIRQFVRYIVVGGIGTLAHLGVLSACVEWFGWPPAAGAVAGFSVALLISYVLNRGWTFQSQRSRLAAFWRYTAVSLGGLALNTGMMMGLIRYAHCDYFRAQLYVIAVVPVCNFLLNRYWTFNAAQRTA
ncbi:GtrA-like protein [Caballeronia fortuita]|uniref:GtrA-like protein n=1 Tax=Caballeronia fortuita TaxID=1777138 RepID=A0A158DMK5_9BURK|nr:GtrA family protein [Caballeronia fortuita]SAK95426.1 GtrA-like protein [Caballeronia fortuita]